VSLRPIRKIQGRLADSCFSRPFALLIPLGVPGELPLQRYQIRFDHDPHQVLKPDFRFPAKMLFRFGGVANSKVDFGRAFIALVVPDKLFPV
jgi:hypothetical protein